MEVRVKSSISISIMCADLANLSKDLKLLEQAQIEYIHVDIMDGSFVPNFTFGPDFCQALRKATSIPLDIHMMVLNPERHVEAFKPQKGEYMSLHVETTCHLQRALALIKSFGAKAAVAINPATPIASIEDVLADVDMVLVMTVNPGYAGQKLVPQTIDKIKRLRSFMDERGYQNIEIQVDGNVNFENAAKMRNAGADSFVAGSSSVFMPGLTILEGSERLRRYIK